MTGSTKLPRALRPEGVIPIDVFHVEIPVWTDEATRIKALEHLGIYVEDSRVTGFNGCVGVNTDTDGAPLISVMITPHADISTWAHEAVHLADLLMDSRGVPTDVNNTEVRAYITGYATLVISEIMAGYHKRMAKQEASKAAKQAAKQSPETTPSPVPATPEKNDPWHDPSYPVESTGP